MDDVEEVRLCEDALRAAMLAGDVDALSALIDDRLVFTGPDGAMLGKAEDLSAHSSKLLRLHGLDAVAATLRAVDGLVVSATRVDLAGTYAGREIRGPFAYTRVWSKASGGWRVIAGHAAAVG